MNKTQTALKWLEQSIEHLQHCNKEDCDWWHEFSAFLSNEGIDRNKAEEWLK